MTCGIYCFTVGTSEKPYIGKSINIGGRITTHKRLIKEGLDSKKILKEAELYGSELKYFIVEECTEEELNEREKFWIKEFNSIKEGLNTSEGGEDWGGSGFSGGNSKYSKEEIEEIFELLLTGIYGFKDIAKVTNSSETLVSQIYKQRTHLWLKDEYPNKYNKMINTSIPRSCHMEPFWIKHRDTGEIVEVKKRNETAEKLNINKKALSMVKVGKRKHTGGWELFDPTS